MQKIPKGLAAIAVVLVLTVAIYYRQVVKMFQSVKTDRAAMTEIVVQKPKEVSAEVRYEVPNDGVDFVRFTLTLSPDGVITDAREVTVETNQADEKQVAFSQGLLAVIKGKRLSELTAVDRIGKSSLTTKAFNSVIDTLKSQI